jgi:hypothetical protein
MGRFSHDQVPGTLFEESHRFRDVETSGLICHVDAYALPVALQGMDAAKDGITSPIASISPITVTPAQLTEPSWVTDHSQTGHERSTIPLTVIPATPPVPGQPWEPDPIIAWVNGAPLRESDSITSQIVVRTTDFVQI